MSEVLDKVITLLLPVVHYLAVLLVLAGVLWAAIEGLGEALPNIAKKKARWKFAIALVLGVLAYGAGFLPTPKGHVPFPGMAKEVFGFLFAALSAWMTAWGVGRIHDRFLRRFRPFRRSDA